MRLQKQRGTNVNFILFSMAIIPAVFAACNTIGGIEPGTLGLCPDGSRIEDTNCEATAGGGGFGSSSNGTGGSGASAVCEAPWQHHDPVGDRCYWQGRMERTWASAEARCVDLGGHLVAIDSAYELGFLAEWIESDVWIGGTDGVEEGVFVWTNEQPWSFTLWKDGEPDDKGDCVMLDRRSDSLPVFDCRPCTEKRSYICESPPLHP